MSAQALIAALQPILQTVAGLDLTDPSSAVASLTTSHPTSSLGHIDELVTVGTIQGWLTPRVATPTIAFGRLAKPTDDSFGLSIDAVDMRGDPVPAAGAAHTHPKGEVSLCFARGGDPRFDGRTGWVVMPPGSRHVPTVTSGRMVILYFLPSGAMAWG